MMHSIYDIKIISIVKFSELDIILCMNNLSPEVWHMNQHYKN